MDPNATTEVAQLTAAFHNYANTTSAQISAMAQQLNELTLSHQGNAPPPFSADPEPTFRGFKLSPKLLPPRSIDGKKPNKVLSWLFKMEQYLGLSTYPLDSPESIIFASLCREGNLALWWEHSCRQADSPTAGFQSWTAFREALLAHLCPPSARPVAMQKMRELQQGRDSVSVFASKFLALLTDLPDWGQDQKIDEFMAKANPDLTLPFAFMPHQPTTLEETIRMLSYYEQQQKQQRIVVKNYNKQAANNRYTTTSASTSYGHRDYSSTRDEPSTSEPMDIGTIRHRVMTIIEGTKTRYPRLDTPRRSSPQLPLPLCLYLPLWLTRHDPRTRPPGQHNNPQVQTDPGATRGAPCQRWAPLLQATPCWPHCCQLPSPALQKVTS